MAPPELQKSFQCLSLAAWHCPAFGNSAGNGVGENNTEHARLLPPFPGSSRY